MRVATSRFLLLGGIVMVGAGMAWRPLQTPNSSSAEGRTLLPNGWSVTPAGSAVPLPGDLPLRIVPLPDGHRAVVTSSGWHDQCATLIDLNSNSILSKLNLGNAGPGLVTVSDKWLVSGAGKKLHEVSLDGDQLVKGTDVANATKGAWIMGMASNGARVWCADVNHKQLIVRDGADERTLPLSGRPYGVVLSSDKKVLAVSLWDQGKVALLNAESEALIGEVAVGSHPSELLFLTDGRLVVTNSGANSVSVIRKGKVVETIVTSQSPKDPIGSTPDALAISPDSKTLYVANADNNDVAVVDLSGRESVVRGFIPTGWYPSALAVTPDGKKLLVGTGKGLKFGPNGIVKEDGQPGFRYIGSLLQGTLNIVNVPSPEELAGYTKQVRANFPIRVAANSDKDGLAGLKKIKHVLYIIRENRTYDQVFGDVPQGNGDKPLVMFGEEVTPNAHAIAKRYALLDNTYCNGEVSEDGHQWCNAAYATDFTEKAWVNSYSSRGEPDDEGLKESPAGYLWDACRKNHIDYRSYGEMASFKSDPDHEPTFNGDKGLEGHASAAWSKAKANGRDPDKADVFVRELQDAEAKGKWYPFMVMSLGEDHTAGLKADAYTPRACVASNDVALGKILDAISHSKFWDSTAVFVIEDDAQNGPDHVDAHRTVALVASPYAKQGLVDSTQYTTVSMVKTMEMILGLKPMTQFDDLARPMTALFTSKPDLAPYTLIPAKIDVNAKNPKKGALALASAKLDFSHYDAADPDELNRILWAAMKPGQPMPAPVRRARIGRR